MSKTRVAVWAGGGGRTLTTTASTCVQFKSRSMEEFQKLREAGKADYNMPMFNAKEKLRKVRR